jgi:hypothetical protein
VGRVEFPTPLTKLFGCESIDNARKQGDGRSQAIRTKRSKKRHCRKFAPGDPHILGHAHSRRPITFLSQHVMLDVCTIGGSAGRPDQHCSWRQHSYRSVGNLFREKASGAAFVGDAFGKLAGSTQENQLGEIETTILLTCTLALRRQRTPSSNTCLHCQGRDVRQPGGRRNQ